jgi:hypothetical protein
MTIKAKPLIFTFFVVLALASAESVSYTPESLPIPQSSNTLVFTATPILVENTSTATSSTSTASSFTNPSYEFYILLAIFSVIVIFFFIYIIRGVRKSD